MAEQKDQTVMSELSFLIELLLNHDLKKETKDLIASRIKEVEVSLVARPASQFVQTTGQLQVYQSQAPSTIAAMARHADIPLSQAIAQAPVVAALNGGEAQARMASMDLIKKRKHQHLKA